MLRRITCLFLGMLLLLTVAYAAEYETEITDDKVLTVRLVDDGTPDRFWDFEISDPSVIDMLTNEYWHNEENVKESGGRFDISFIATGGEASGESLITFKYKDEGIYGRVFDQVMLSVYPVEGEIRLVIADTVCIHDNQLAVCFEANATTGYEWTYEVDGEGILSLVSEEYVPVESDMVGSGGHYNAVFKSIQPGANATLTFNYARSWESEEPGKTIVVFVQTAEDGQLDFEVKSVN